MTSPVQDSPVAEQRRGLSAIIDDYIQLTKPRIIALLLVTTYAAMLIAAGTVPPLLLIALTLLGGTLTSASANAINMVYDRDIDALMTRTRRRPLPAGRISPRGALIFAITLGVVGFAVLAVYVNLLAAVLAISGNLFYVFIYTMWLKRSSVQNIVIGGAAGAVPPLVGWAAVTGSLNMAALVLFLIIFLWTPPHFWALAFYKNEDYRLAGVPMMPVVHGEDVTIRQILLYTAVLVPSTILLALFHPMTVFYVISALVVGGIFAYFAIKLARDRSVRSAKQLFAYSIVYLGLIFGAMVVDRVVLGDVIQPLVPARGVSGLPVDHMRSLDVQFGATIEDGLPIEVIPSTDEVHLHPNESKQLHYTVRNLSDEPLLVMADHDVQPEVALGFFKKIECFCFQRQRLEPGEEARFPVVFSFVDAIPPHVEQISVSYGFQRLLAGDPAPVGHDHSHDHAHEHGHISEHKPVYPAEESETAAEAVVD